MPSFDRQAFKDAFNRRVQEVRDADNKKRKSELRETHNNHAVHIKQDPDDLDSPLHSIESTPKHSQSKSAKKCDDTTGKQTRARVTCLANLLKLLLNLQMQLCLFVRTR